MPRAEDDIEVEKLSDGIEEEEDLSRRDRMLVLIDKFLTDRGEEMVHALEWDMLCPCQEEVLFVIFFVDNVPADYAITALRGVLEEALKYDHC